MDVCVNPSARRRDDGSYVLYYSNSFRVVAAIAGFLVVGLCALLLVFEWSIFSFIICAVLGPIAIALMYRSVSTSLIWFDGEGVGVGDCILGQKHAWADLEKVTLIPIVDTVVFRFSSGNVIRISRYLSGLGTLREMLLAAGQNFAADVFWRSALERSKTERE